MPCLHVAQPAGIPRPRQSQLPPVMLDRAKAFCWTLHLCDQRSRAITTTVGTAAAEKSRARAIFVRAVCSVVRVVIVIERSSTVQKGFPSKSMRKVAPLLSRGTDPSLSPSLSYTVMKNFHMVRPDSLILKKVNWKSQSPKKVKVKSQKKEKYQKNKKVQKIERNKNVQSSDSGAKERRHIYIYIYGKHRQRGQQH